MQEFWFKHADNDTYMVQFYRGDDPEVTVPSSWYGCDVTVLMDDIFKGHAEITKVNLPDTLTDIGGFVFDIDEYLMDASIKHQLELIREQFIERNRRII